MYISKRQKRAIRERRKRKKLAAEEPETDGHGSTKSLCEELVKTVEKSAEIQEKLSLPPNMEISSDGNQMIIIPLGLSSKESKKFRKDMRRQARKEGIDGDTLVFQEDTFQQTHDTDEKNTAKAKKRKREFPRINQLMKEDKEAGEKKLMKEAMEKSELRLSDEIKDKYRAVDCEMVGIGIDGKISALARASVTNWDGEILLDTFVKVPSKVTDFRTKWSGVKARDLKSEKAMSVEDCRSKVSALLKGKVLVGHALKNDLDALMLTHPKENIRDTARYRPYQRLAGRKWRPRKLRDLVKEFCDIQIQQEGEAHDSVDDARAAMQLFKVSREPWELEISRNLKRQRKPN